MTSDEAREAALRGWQDWQSRPVRQADFNGGWDARGAHDAQEVAGLVDILARLVKHHHESDDWGGYCFFCRGVQTLDYEREAHDYLDHTSDCPWIEGMNAVAERRGQ